MVKWHYGELTMYMVLRLLRSVMYYEWISIATSLLIYTEDLDRNLHILESLSWLIPKVPPDTFHNTVKFDDHWVVDRFDVPGSC